MARRFELIEAASHVLRVGCLSLNVRLHHPQTALERVA